MADSGIEYLIWGKIKIGFYLPIYKTDKIKSLFLTKKFQQIII